MGKGSGGTKNSTTHTTIVYAEQAIRSAYEEFEEKGYITMKPFSIGEVSSKVVNYANENNIQLAGNTIYMTSNQLQHARRSEKVSDGVAVSVDDMANFPNAKRYMDIYYDKDSRKFIYTDHRNKFIIHPHGIVKFEKKEKAVNFITASKVTDDNEFKMKKYVKIK